MPRDLPKRLLASILLAVLLPAAPLTAQDEDDPPPEILGQPAGWSVEPEQASTLIPIPAGSTLRTEPSREAAALAVLPDAKLVLFESSPPWVKVQYGELIGWIDLEAERSRPDRNEEAPPPQPRFEAGNIEPTGELGPYTLWGPIRDRAVLAYLDRVATDHARLYSERYGLEIETPIAGDVKYFSGRAAFVVYARDQGDNQIDFHGNGYFKSPSLVVMHGGRGDRRQIAATLVHELTHLLSWHLLGGWRRGGTQMAPWLEEGLADDMAFASSDRKGNLKAEPLGPSNLRYGERMGAKLFKLERQIEAGIVPSVAQLLDMDHQDFMGGPREIHYTLSALWVRYLLSDPDLAERFRAFLPLVARGAAADSTNLVSHLGRDWSQLERDFRAWRRRQQLRF